MAISLLFFGIILYSGNAFSQCTNCAANYPSGTYSTTSDTWTTITTCNYSGEYSYYNLDWNYIYQWSTFGSSYDTQLTLYGSTTCSGANLAYNDDCVAGTTSLVAYYPGATSVRMLMDRFYCVTYPDANTCLYLNWRAIAKNPTISASTLNICNGGSATLTASNIFNNDAYVDVNWGTFAGGTDVGVDVNSVTVSPTVTTSYYLEYAVRYGYGYVYSNYASVTVFVYDPPTVGTISGAPASACVGNAITYTLSGNSGVFNRFQYQWNSTGGVWSDLGSTNPYTWTASNPGNTLYVRAVIDNGPCTGYSTPVSTYVSVSPAGATLANPILVGGLTCTPYSNTQNNITTNCFANDYGQLSDDIYYQFTLGQTTIVNMSHCSSVVSDTYMSLLNSSGGLIFSNDDSGPICGGLKSSMQQSLASGTYYVVSEGYYNYTGDITTDIYIPIPAGGSITGTTPVCPNTTGVAYSVSGVSTATSYTWSVPSGASVASG